MSITEPDLPSNAPVSTLPAFASDELLAAIVASSSDCIISKTLAGIITSWNASAHHLFGYTADEMIGQSIRRIIPADRQHEEDMIIARIGAGETLRSFETVRQRKSGEFVQVSVTVSPIHSTSGIIIGASKIVRDITDLKEAELRLRRSDLRQRQLLDNSLAFMFLLDGDGRVVEANAGSLQAMCSSREAVIGRRFEELPWWRHGTPQNSSLRKIVERCLAGETVACDLEFAGVEDDIRCGAFLATPTNAKEGGDSGAVISGVDITDRKRAFAHTELLMREVNHRAKNMLGIVTAIARQTGGDTRDAFVAAFTDRVRGLAAAQDLLLQGGAHGVALEDLAHAQLAHMKDLLGSRITLTGPKLQLQPAAAQCIGMALYELATNASKFGALSNDTGKVALVWSVEEMQFSMSWQETAGPPVVAPPTRRGFGRTVLIDLPRLRLGAVVSLSFPPEGVTWSMTAPPAHVEAIDS